MTDKNAPPHEDYQGFVVAEYNYIVQTAFQAHEDRARVSEFFLVSFGTFLAALFSSQFANIEPITANTLFSILFIIIAFWGGLTVLELTRLRLAWLESVLSMNKVKDFIIRKSPTLEDCFSWRIDTIPRAFKLRSVGFLKALQVSILSGTASGASASFVSFSHGNSTVPWCMSISVACATTLVYMTLFYYLPLQTASISKTLRDLKNKDNEPPAEK